MKSRRFTSDFGFLSPFVIRISSFISPSLTLESGCQVDRAANALVGAAAADVARHAIVYIPVGGIRVFAEQQGGGHDLARLAIAALGHVLADPGLLQRAANVGRKTLDGDDLFSLRAGDRRHTRPHRLTIEM